MPAVSAPATVLVTGANGYVAVYVVKYLLERGYKVRGTVRSADKGEAVKAVVGDGFEYFIIADVNAPGAFDEALQGVDVIQSIGAPMPNKITHADDIVKPAVEGTVALLESARKAGTVKRVIITSTAFTIMAGNPGQTHYTEDDWNDGVVEAFKQDPATANEVLAYAASKMYVEREVLAYLKKHEGTLNFDVVTLLPTNIFGPPLLSLNPNPQVAFSSAAALLSGFVAPEKTPFFFKPDAYVDVRDAAELHVRAAYTEAASNQRIALIAGPFSWDAAFKAVGLPRTAKPEELNSPNTYSKKSEEVFDFKYQTLEESVKETWEYFVEHGYVSRDGKANF